MIYWLNGSYGVVVSLFQKKDSYGINVKSMMSAYFPSVSSGHISWIITVRHSARLLTGSKQLSDLIKGSLFIPAPYGYHSITSRYGLSITQMESELN